MKTVVKNINDKKKIVETGDADAFNIYAFKGFEHVFKLHRINDLASPTRYAFISMADSECYADGTSESVEEALENSLSSGNAIYEFDSEKEFYKWAIEVADSDEEDDEDEDWD